MGRKDLSVKSNNSNFGPTRNHHPFYVSDYYENDIDDENDQDIEEETSKEQENIDMKQPENNDVYNLEEYNEEEQYDDLNTPEKKKTNKIINYTQLAKKEVKDDTNKKIKAIIFKNPIVKKVILIAIPIIIILLLLIFLIAIISSIESSDGLATEGYFAMRCQEVTVIMTDKSNNYAVVETKTYPLEDYVAGVVSAEVGMFNDIEVFKEFAILARSYLLTHDDNCTIESSDRQQVFRDITAKSTSTDQLIYQAVDETKGKVLLRNNEITSSQYDAFACIAEDSNYYTIAQANQKVPKSWIDGRISRSSMPDWFICNGKANLRNHHGNGVSQYGSLYLASTGYKYNEILQFYLGDEVTISRGGFMSSVLGLEIKDTTNATELHDSLSVFLPGIGSSVDEYNAYIRNSVMANGLGTREGVVTAAVSFINFLYDGAGVRVPYMWGGNYQQIGVDPSFGGRVGTTTDIYGRSFSYNGFDCSGFVSWAIRNGGYSLSRHTTATFHSTFAGDSCNIASSNCMGQPGDLINSASCHVQMIVAVDQNSGVYYVAESTGSYGAIMRAVGMHNSNCGGKETRILHMDNYYNNRANVSY